MTQLIRQAIAQITPRRVIAAALLLAIPICGCGYRQTNQYEKGPAVGQGPILEVRSVAVPTFKNESGVAGVEAPLTQAIRDAIASKTIVKLMTEQKADSAIQGTITEVKLRPPATQVSSPADIRSMRIEYRWHNLWTETDILDPQIVDIANYDQAARAVTTYMRGNDPLPGPTTFRWHALYREDVRTVATPIFTNRTYVRGVEMQLSKAIGNYLEASTPYKIVSREQAETVLEGEIVSVTGNPVSYDKVTALPQQEMVTITVNFLWKDLRTGKILVQRKNFSQSTMYYPTLGEGLFIGTGGNVEKLGQAIVQQLQADW